MNPRSFPPEWRRATDSATGASVLQWTSHPCMNHHLYFTNPTCSADTRRGFFVSYRNGYPNLFSIDLTTGGLLQLTERKDINPFSLAPSLDSAWVYFSAGSFVRAVSTTTGEEQEISRLTADLLGNCSISADGHYLAIALRHAEDCEMAVVDLRSGRTELVTRAKEIGHIQFCPGDSSLLEFSGTVRQRIWLHDRRSGENRYLYDQPASEWIVHESWLGGGEEVVFVHWPKRLCAISRKGGQPRVLSEINAWHACSNRDGSLCVADTAHPDRGLILIDTKTGKWRTLCMPGASCRGTQWLFDQPAIGAGMDTSIIRSRQPELDPPPKPTDPASTYGPQWSHPHPRFTPDERHVVYTSDRGGWSQVYMVAC